MKSDRKRWTITRIASSAYNNILSLDIKYQELVEKKLDSLQDNPYEGDIKKIQGKKNIYRSRIGDYGFYFRTFPESKSIEILLFEHRGDIKKKAIQRLK